MEKEKKKFKLNFQITVVIIVLVTAISSVLGVMLMTLPKAEDLLEKSVLSQMGVMAQAERDLLEFKHEEYMLENWVEDYEFYNESLSSVKVQGMSGSYAYVVDATGTMLYHPTQDKVGNAVENSVVKGLVGELQSGKIPKDDVVAYEYKGAIKYAGYAITSRKEIVVVTADRDEAMADCSKLTSRGILVAVIVILVLLAIGLYIAMIISKPLKKVAEVTERLSEGYINDAFEIKSFIAETEAIGKAAKVLQDNLQAIVGEIRSASGNLAVSVQDTRGLCNQASDGSNQVDQAVGELATTATTMAESVQSLNGNIVDIGNNIESITGAVGELNNSSAMISKISDEATEDIGEVFSSSEKSVIAVQNIAEHMSRLTEAISRVTAATEMISSIADQTKLLSLNASIEAARAGDQGKGFAVVAGEIGNLASSSSDSVNQINDIVKDILSLSEQSAKVTEEIKTIISGEQSVVTKTQKSFTSLKAQIDLSLKQIAQIASETESLAYAKEGAISAVSDLSAISEENAASCEESSASVTNIASNIADINDRSTSMAEMADTLEKAIEAFKE